MAAQADLVVERTAQEILAYLRANPAAADSVDGVKLWLDQGGRHPPASAIERALDLLVERGEVVAVELAPGGHRIYRRALPDAPGG